MSMVTPSGPTSASLTQSLKEETYRFDFFQVVRVLEALAKHEANEVVTHGSQPIGYDAAPSEELVRFRALASYNFAQADIHSFVDHLPGQDSTQHRPPNLSVCFMGLFGPKGTLPRHYTRSIIEQNDLKNYALRDLLDVFNHRAISLFYRAWEKHRLPAAFERSQTTTNEHQEDQDLFTQCLLSLVGLGTKGLSSRQEISDQALLYYSGHFSHSPRSAVALQQILSDYFDFEVKVIQFQGEWLALTQENQSSLECQSLAFLSASNNRLGLDTIAGEHVWCVGSKFRIQIGPVDYPQYQRLMPGGDDLVQLAQLVRSFVGLTLDFDVQPILLSEEIPDCQLDDSTTTTPKTTESDSSLPTGAQLGRNTWMFSTAPTADVSDGIFVHSGSPTRG